MRRLPPFPELVAFEAVARHLSFTRAATELCVTQSAISHRVRRLEKHFDQRLVRRLNPGIELTPAGATLLPEVVAILDSLSRLTGRRERRLRVAAGHALCTWWLAGRLSNFMTLRPDISVELVPIGNDQSIPEVDVRILWVSGENQSPHQNQAALFSEHVFPVCSPKLVAEGRMDKEALCSMNLLHKSAHDTGEWSWNVWFERLGIKSRRRGGELRFADMSLAMSAAVDGSGIALTRTLLAYDALRDGRLVIPFVDLKPMISSKHHVARWRRGKADDPVIQSFVRWLATEAESTLANSSRFFSAGSGDSSSANGSKKGGTRKKPRGDAATPTRSRVPITS